MLPGTVAMVLAAAVAHAVWNLASKCKRGEALLFVCAYTYASALLCVPISIAFKAEGQQVLGWPLAAGAAVSAVLHTAYSLTLQAGYERAELGVVYPVARGIGPVLAMLFAILLLDEQLTAAAMFGASLVMAGVLVVTGNPFRNGSRRPLQGLLWGAATGSTIAAYTIWDAYSVVALHLAPVSYYAATLVLQSLILTPSLLRRRHRIRAAIRADGVPILIVAVFSPLAYILVLTAMLEAPVALVAPLRESSIVIGSIAAYGLFGDRRVVLLGFSALMVGSNLLVAASSSLAVLLLMRILLGIALGGFWSMAAAVAMRLVPAALLPRALSIIFSGIAVGTVVAVPLGSYLGGRYGWRSAFLAAAAVGVVTLAFQWFTLPRLAPAKAARLRTVLEVLLRPGIGVGMLGCVLVHTGHFALFTYIRPFLESTTGVGPDGLALMLLGFGVANFVGTLLAGWMLHRSVRVTLVLMPALVGVAALALVGLPATVAGQALLLALWGLAFGAVPVAWSNWVAQTVPDQAESAGGMVVASVQSAIAAGAAAGGAMFSVSGIAGVFVAAGILMLLAALPAEFSAQANVSFWPHPATGLRRHWARCCLSPCKPVRRHCSDPFSMA